MSLEGFGWCPFFSASFEAMGVAACEPGRVAAVHREMYAVWLADGEVTCELSGRLRYASDDWPTVGDWVAVRGRALIDGLLPRRTSFVRKQPGSATAQQALAANVNVVFVVMGMDGDFSLRRLERYLVLVAHSGARAAVVLNKADLVADPASYEKQARAAVGGEPVFVVSALAGAGLDQIRANAGETAALIGSSGAGKSTILNWLLGEERQPTQAVRESDSKGRHTTSHRQLFVMPGGWLLMDLPGLREVQLWAGGGDLDSAFPDIDELAASCRFRDCRHESEPECAVTAAVTTGTLDPARLASYRQLGRELAHLERQVDQRAALEQKREHKAMHRAQRAMYSRRLR